MNHISTRRTAISTIDVSIIFSYTSHNTHHSTSSGVIRVSIVFARARMTSLSTVCFNMARSVVSMHMPDKKAQNVTHERMTSPPTSTGSPTVQNSSATCSSHSMIHNTSRHVRLETSIILLFCENMFCTLYTI